MVLRRYIGSAFTTWSRESRTVARMSRQPMGWQLSDRSTEGGRMRTRGLARALAIATGVMAISATAVEAQAFDYFTTGYFSSPFGTCNQGPGGAAPTAVCSGGGFTLTYTGQTASGVGYLSGSQIELGDFVLSGSGNVTVPPATVSFTLIINQTMPTVGTGNHAGFITGSVTVGGGPSFSSLLWSPNEISVIGPVTYDLIFDQGTSGIRIPAPPGEATVKAIGTVSSVIPEPSTYLLLGSGLLGLAGFARRRRTSV